MRSWTHAGDQVWVHPDCGQPSRAAIEADMTNIQLNYFYYGPYHNTVVTTTDLVYTPHPLILEYRWTPSLLTGSESGRQARVWLHQSVESGVLEALTQ